MYESQELIEMYESQELIEMYESQELIEFFFFIYMPKTRGPEFWNRL